MDATRNSWRITTLPTLRKSISIDRSYSSGEFDRLKKGVIPFSMEDKWFVFYEEPWLYLHRSWTGICLFQVRFELADGISRVVEALVNRDPKQYGSTDDIGDALFATAILDSHAGREDRSAWEQWQDWQDRKLRSD